MNTLETLQDILIDEFDLTREQVAPQASLTALGVDSLDLLELMFKIEDKYQLVIRDDVPNDLATVGDVAAYIDRLLARQTAGPDAGPTKLSAAT